MAETTPTHYLVGVADEPVSHIHAKDQLDAVTKFVQGENEYGYDAENYDGVDVIVVAFSKASTFAVHIVQPSEPELRIEKVKNRG